jgi:hypothetical protein
MDQRDTPVSSVSWGPLATVGTFAALSAMWVALTPAGEQTELAGRTWEQFALQDPEVANLVSRQLNVLGFLGGGFGLLAAVVSLLPFRRGERWAWYALWLFPITIGAVAARQLIDQYPPGYYYAALTAVAVGGLLLPARRFLRPIHGGSQPDPNQP